MLTIFVAYSVLYSSSSSSAKLLTTLLISSLVGCNRGILSSNISATISSPTISSSSSISEDKPIEIPDKSAKDYLQKALTSLFLLNNYCEIKHIKNDEETISSFYYDFTKNIYQFNYKSNLITYRDSKIYYDSNDYHYYMNSKEFNGYTLITSVIALEYIDLDFLEINKEGSNVTLSYGTNYASIAFNIKEGLVTSLTNVEINMLNSSIIITPKKVAKGYISIDKNNHQNLFKSLETLSTYLSFFNIGNMEMDLSLNYKDININGTLLRENLKYTGKINYSYFDSNFSIDLLDNTYKFNDEEVDLATLIQSIYFNLEQNVIDELLDYTYNILDSKKEINDNKIIFTNDNFNEEITFNSKDMTITFSTLNLKIKCKKL